MTAKQRGATIIHIDPRFSRTSAMADLHVPIRPGSDLVFLGALVNYAVENDKWFHDYVLHYTNAPVIIHEDYQDTEDLAGIFSGYDHESRNYQKQSWQYAGEDSATNTGEDEGQTAEARQSYVGASYGPAQMDYTLQHPRCVFQIIKRHFARYTPEMVERSCGVPPELFAKVADAVTRNSGRERTTSFCYAVAWTQHTNGTQTISACALLQLLLGNIGRPGGGILALRGHATIQGSTDIPTLYNLLPGYMPMPSASDQHATLADYLENETPETGWMYHTPKYMVSLLKAWYGENATQDNDFCYDLVPKIDGDYSFQAMLTMMKDGDMTGLFCMGQNPAVGGQNAVLAREALANLDWLVVRDAHEIESAAFWHDSPEVRSGKLKPEDIKTEIFLLPASIAGEKDGSFTNTQRLIQWHDRAADPPGHCRSDVWFVHDLGQRLKKLYAHDDSPTGRQIKAITMALSMSSTSRMSPAF
jgi:formate dehydrogenase major subunit